MKYFDLSQFKDRADAAIEKKCVHLGRYITLLAVISLTLASAYGMIAGACYLWLSESMTPQTALLATALISVTFALVTAAVWRGWVTKRKKKEAL